MQKSSTVVLARASGLLLAPGSVAPEAGIRNPTPSSPRRRAGRADRAPSLPCHRPRLGARRLRPDRPTPAQLCLVPGLRSFGPGWILLPLGPALQQGPHDAHEVLRRRPRGVFLARRVAALAALEVRPPRRRAPPRLPARLGQELADDRRSLARDVPQPVPVARLVLAR